MIEANTIRIENNPDYYRQRQQITEYPFGTLKRQRGFTFTVVRGKDNVLGEAGQMFIEYNLSRCITVLGAEKLIKALKKCCLPNFFMMSGLVLSRIKGYYIKSSISITVRMGKYISLKLFY